MSTPIVGCGRGTLLQPQYRQPPGMSLESACTLQELLPAVPLAEKTCQWPVSGGAGGISAAVADGGAFRLQAVPAGMRREPARRGTRVLRSGKARARRRRFRAPRRGTADFGDA